MAEKRSLPKNNPASQVQFCINRNMVERFAVLTGDTSALHIDRAFARRSIFRENVAHGMLPVLFLSALPIFARKNKVFVKDLSAQFLKPVFVGDNLLMEANPNGSNQNENTSYEFTIKNADSGALLTHGVFSLADYGEKLLTQKTPDVKTVSKTSRMPLTALKEENLRFEDISIGSEKGFSFLISGVSCKDAFGIVKSGLLKSGNPAFSDQAAGNLLASSLFSTLVGLSLPGRHATFLDFQVNFHNALSIFRKYSLKGKVGFKSESTSTVVEDIAICDADNKEKIHATGKIKSRVNPPEAKMPSIESLKKNGIDPRWKDLKDKVVLVTGASRGIGETIAKLFSLYGAKVVVNYFKGKNDALRVVTEIEKNGGQAICIGCDVSDPQQVKEMVAKVYRQFGTVDVLVNNAVRDYLPISFPELSWDDVEADLNVNVKGAFHCCQEVLPLMKKNKSGKIINISTMAVENPPPKQTKYIVSKSALEGLSRSLAVEYAAQNIQIYLVAPSFVETDLTKHISKIFVNGMKGSALKKTTPQEVAKAVLSLASSQSTLKTGQKITVAGDNVNIKETALAIPNYRDIIEGRTVMMRPISRGEITDRYVSWLNNPEVNQYLDSVRHKKQTASDIVDYINGVRAKEGCDVFAIFTKSDERHIGNIGVTLFNAQQGYAGYGILIGDQKAREFGLGGEATVLIVEYLFRNPKIRRIQENTYSDNEKSWRTLEMLGFKKEGVLREHVVLSNGRRCDLYVHGMLREEWKEHRRKVAPVVESIKIKELTTNLF